MRTAGVWALLVSLPGIYSSSSGAVCLEDSECASECCFNLGSTPICIDRPQAGTDEECFASSGCDCISGICGDNGDLALIRYSCRPPEPVVDGDPHMTGLRGQKIDWSGEDGGYYVLLSDSDRFQMSVRLTAPLPKDFPDRQLITGFALKYGNDHSIVIETKNPYTTETEDYQGDDIYLSENALRIIIDGEEHQAVPFKPTALTTDSAIAAMNLPAECQPFGGDVIWAATFAAMSTDRRLGDDKSLGQWARDWVQSTAAPTWCEKYLNEAGDQTLLQISSKHSVFRISTPFFDVRLHHGTNHQGGEVIYDGRVLPELEFWQMDVHLERYDIDSDTATGILGETIRPVLDNAGSPIMSGLAALRGDVEDYRVSGPLASDFTGFQG